MTGTTLTRSDSSTASEHVAAAGLRMYDAETTLRAARQTDVDAWIMAAAEKLHIAIAEHTAAVLGSVAAHASAA
jgi:hypothetical protein